MDARTGGPRALHEWKSWIPPLACLPIAMLSMAITGFQFGVANNIYHIPYVLDFASSPEFAGQPFAQSLNKFTSAVWPVVRLVANESNVRDVFFLLACASRLLALVAVLYLIRLEADMGAIGVQLACLAVIAATPLMTGYSPLGSHGLFLPYFTHTEVTWAPVLVSLAMMGRNRLGAAAGFAGGAFLLNAFVGLWMVFINLASRAFDRRRLPPPSEVFAYLGVFALVASPVMWWILSAVLETRQGVSFSYIDYVREFYPNHFLIEAADWDRIGALVVMFGCGLIAALHLREARYWMSAQFAIAALLVVGTLMPYVVNQRFVFNLHLLRADGLEQAVATILCVVAGIKLWSLGASKRQRWMGAIVLLCLLSWPKSLAAIALPTVAIALLAGLDDHADGAMVRRVAGWICGHQRALAWLASAGLAGLMLYEIARSGPSLQVALRIAFAASALWLIFRSPATAAAAASAASATHRAVLAGVALSVGVAGLTSYQRIVSEAEAFGSARSRDWGQMLEWVRTSDVHGVFLMSLEMSDEFELKARRPVWVGARQGAAVMWEPSFHAHWVPRFRELLSLKTASELIAYGELHDIRHVMIDTETGDCVAPGKQIQRFGPFALCRIEPAVRRD